jgi:hypothetical protein
MIQLCSKYLQRCYICYKKRQIATNILQTYSNKLHDKTCKADLQQLQSNIFGCNALNPLAAMLQSSKCYSQAFSNECKCASNACTSIDCASNSLTEYNRNASTQL